MTPRRKRRLVLTVAGLCVLVAAAVVTVLLIIRPSGEQRPATLVIPEGHRATQVYAAIDKALGEPAGTTKKAAKKGARDGTLGLPRQAHGNPEGYLFPATYPVDRNTTPSSLLSYMVNTAKERIPDAHAGAYETVVVASLVQAEADTPEDMAKVARVIDNRLDQHKPLEFDSTINYALGRSTLTTTHADTRLDSPYNTYRHKGLPPTPVNNPGEHALRAAANPPKGDWLYFVTVKPGDTRFSTTYAQHEKHVREFNREQGN
ncbi:endolytic transglycosylase MltG [Streptomyces sp. HNM0574]|uniref:endolytic transglycosylase MltG n=1 Tax=Streptomyces sp. HNM0574 TaxID=2714954 RepID=UPI00146A5D1F|nr:endolytic transglycosylase MltG [Streptomyces sp. HNM0574]NLU68058.1 endolytic transglycosylase MltG [Streptomyces sp. HNM0574]